MKVLLVGESWVSAATHYKGFDQFGSVTFHLGAEPLVAALKDSPFDLVYMPAHEAVNGLPARLEGLQAYDAILLSDIGANSLLLHPDVWLHGKTYPNRLRLLRDYAAAGGGLVMIGGYFSFQGIDGKARWGRTPVEDALPVTCLPYDDRLEIPEGFKPVLTGPRRPSDPRRPRHGLARPARRQRGDPEAASQCRGPGHAARRPGRPPAARDRAMRARPYGSMDFRHRPALAAAKLRRVARLCEALGQPAGMGDGAVEPRSRADHCDRRTHDEGLVMSWRSTPYGAPPAVGHSRAAADRSGRTAGNCKVKHVP